MSQITSEAITVSFDGKRCIHARRCVLGLPGVFRAGAEGQWIFPDAAAAEEIARIIDTCPSGALGYVRHDGGLPEQMPQVNTLRPGEDGPNEIRGDIHIDGHDPRKRTMLCRCGHSQNMPFCDNSHLKADFRATSDIPSRADAPTLEVRNGPLHITPTKNGPNRVKGNLEIIAGSGRRVATGTTFFLCRCGHSKDKPFCDGSHKAAGFEAD